MAALGRAEADPRLFRYCADNLGNKPGIADALAKNSACPTALVTRVASDLSSAGVQALLDNLDRLSSDPHLVLALNQVKTATIEQRELIPHLQGGALALKELEEAAAEIEPDHQKRQTLLQKVARMTVVQRIQSALKGGREERMLLIRDSNKIVQRGVLQSPRLTESEVESFAAMANLTGEVLRLISMNRNFIKNYTIAKNLVKNPKTPLDISLHLLPRLTSTDLKLLVTNKNIPETLRTAANKLYRQRNMKPGS
ncbi:MAG: hypothetical protein ACRD4S_12025 [Candidatus Acidiferrales bacterium]